ncbi:MAG: EAL domain-containing protein [Ruminococcaceae bacterium]|nr:EAL domain-containing protein [Oscillospiraceae bacterium]
MDGDGDDVDWHYETELVSLVLLVIIWIYSHGYKVGFSIRNRIFQSCYYTLFFSMTVNVLYLIMFTYHSHFVTWQLLAVWTVHQLATALCSTVCQLYVLAYVYENTTGKFLWNFLLSLLPYAGFLVLICLNPVTGSLLRLNGDGLAMHGPLYFLVYGIHYLYALIMVITIFSHLRSLPAGAPKTLLFIPFTITVVAVLQYLFPHIILSGYASVCVLLVAYLYLQNKRIWEDQLTGLPNRVAYLQTLNWRIRQKRPMTVMVVSLNDYKFINDKFGQANGDFLLKSISSYLKSVVSPKDVYRFGGDKFAVIFDENRINTCLTDISRIAERFNHVWEIPGNVCHISAAIGAAQYPASASSSGELVSMLESAVERAKYLGSAQPIFCDREIIGQIRRKHTLYEILRSALASNRLEVYYQPLYSISRDSFTEVEALVRIRDDNGNFLFPEEFVPLAEETGLVVEIGYEVLKQVCEYIRKLLQRGFPLETVSVNLSISQMMRPDFVPRALQIIRASGVSPSRIIFEITESLLVSNYEMISEKIRQLSDVGIRFALDDFGTGYSNLSHVIDLPFQMVKIDKSLIWDSINNSKCYIMVRDMSKIFRSMNLAVTAEGVETADHDRFARICGCSRIQGFRYARPLPGEEAEKYLGRSRTELTDLGKISSFDAASHQMDVHPA